MIISFAWTTDAVRRREKTVTRRFWKASHAAKFYPGRVVKAYTKDARAGGQHFANIRISSVIPESLQRLLDDPFYAREEMIKEGNLWGSVEDFIGLWRADFDAGRIPFRVEFEIIEILN